MSALDAKRGTRDRRERATPHEADATHVGTMEEATCRVPSRLGKFVVLQGSQMRFLGDAEAILAMGLSQARKIHGDWKQAGSGDFVEHRLPDAAPIGAVEQEHQGPARRPRSGS